MNKKRENYYSDLVNAAIYSNSAEARQQVAERVAAELTYAEGIRVIINVFTQKEQEQNDRQRASSTISNQRT